LINLAKIALKMAEREKVRKIVCSLKEKILVVEPSPLF
jgi:hypothetical protein